LTTVFKKQELQQHADKIFYYTSFIRRKWLILLLLALGVFVMAIVSVNAGSYAINPWEVIKAFFGAGSQTTSLVIWHIRMPRIITAIIAGAGLSVAGCVMQNNLKNPLASPDTLGVSAGAAFGANLAIIVLGAGTVMNTAGDAVAINNPYMVTVFAFIFSMGAAMIILALGRIRGFSPEAIVLAGVALGALFMAGTTMIQYFAPDVKIAAAIFWTFGDLGRVSWHEAYIIIAVVLLAAVYFVAKRWDYNAMDNGEETAKSLGVHTERTRFFGMLIASLITSVTVSFLGIIGFIGLIGPHIMRRVIGADHRFLIPASLLAGALLLLLADTAARTVISPVVLPVGALTSILGAPLFIYLLMKGMKEGALR
jgi:iron complex transport system permease protein